MSLTTYNNGVWKKGLGTKLDLKYIIETTEKNEFIDELHYSNLKQFERNSLNEALKLINLFQQHGYHNINLMLQIDHNKETILEDVTESELEFAINSSHSKQIRELKNRNEQLHEENNIYKDFIKQFKAEKLFNEFMLNYKDETTNKDENNLYWYEMLYRPLSPFCQPKGHIHYNETKGRHGIIAYDRPLTSDELSQYELREWTI